MACIRTRCDDIHGRILESCVSEVHKCSVGNLDERVALSASGLVGFFVSRAVDAVQIQLCCVESG